MSASHSYDGDEDGVTLAWVSDLQTAWEERDFDITQNVEDGEGQTVGGTTDDDLGEVTTSFLPSSVDADELTDTQTRILEAAAMRPTASRYEVSAAVDASPQYVGRICGEHLPDHPAASVTDDDETDQTTLDAFGGEPS